MKKIIFSLLAVFIFLFQTNAQDRFVTKTGQARIFSNTAAENITAANNNVSGIMNFTTGDIAISVPVQSFQFEKSLMQEHFNNSNFMDSKNHPKITLKGKIADFSAVNLSKNGTYEVLINGDLTIRGTTKPITEKAHITVDNGKLSIHSKFIVKNISGYGVGKPSGSKKNNVAEDIEVTYTAIYEKEAS